MPLVNVNTLLPQIGVNLVSCPEPVQLQALRFAGRDFCRESEIWREALAVIELEDGDDSATIGIPVGYDADFLRVEEVNTRRTTDPAANDRALTDPIWSFGTDNVLTLKNAVVVDTKLTATAVFLPRISCSTYPDWLMNRWSEAFVAGTLARLMRQRRKPWSNPEEAGDHETAYCEAIGKAKREGWQERQSGVLHFQVGRLV